MSDTQDTPNPWAPPSSQQHTDSPAGQPTQPSPPQSWGAPDASQAVPGLNAPDTSAQQPPLNVYSGWEPSAPAAGTTPPAPPTPPTAAQGWGSATPGQSGQPGWNGAPSPSSPSWAPAPQPNPSWGSSQPNGASWAPAPQPGVIPLRPLSVGDLLEGSFRAIRANPAAMFAFSLAVMALVAVLSALIEYLAGTSLTAFLSDPTASIEDQLTYAASGISSTILTSVTSTALSSIASMVLMGMLGLTVWDAVLGRQTSVADAWNRFKGRLLPLLGATILVSLSYAVAIGLLAGLYILLVGFLFFNSVNSVPDPGMFVGVFFLAILMLAAVVFVVFGMMAKMAYVTTTVVLEGLSPFAAFSRSWKLTQGAFWRTFGRLLLMTVLVMTITGILGTLTGVLTGVVAALGSLTSALFLSVFVSTLLEGLVLPINVAYQTLMYVDERIRKENIAPQIAAEAARL